MDTLLVDNQRAANIIGSLRSIFMDDKIPTSRINVGELVQSVFNIANPEILSKNITVKKNIESNLYFNTNRGEIQQVILNLINNAIQALADSQQTNKIMFSFLGICRPGH
ncbi:HAMP domain-containing histidine kinase [Polynucleobacter necessarius]|uniref:HAMP domain-containing histidine kinase n=1 Tax=Polynucleobacter necessarius TaxID=576610 RepID=UPI000E09AD07|nr:HAMP domain-containing histidine kinase [Polynucleobacter necessarius]